MRTEDDLRAALTALERHAPLPARVSPGRKRHSSQGLRSPRAIGWLAGITIVAALAGVVTTLILPGGTGSTPENGGVTSPAIPVDTALRAKLLAAFSTTGDEIVYVHGTFTTTGNDPHTDHSPAVTESWYYPWQPGTGQQVRSRSITYDLGGLFHSDGEVIYTMPAPTAGTGIALGAVHARGEQISVDYVGKQWSEEKNVPLTIQNPDNPSLIAYDLKTKPWTAHKTTLDGQPTLKLVLKVKSWTTYLWVDASTYLPLRETDNFGPPGMVTNTTVDFQYLPATRANLAKLSPPIPAGFKRIS